MSLQLYQFILHLFISLPCINTGYREKVNVFQKICSFQYTHICHFLQYVFLLFFMCMSWGKCLQLYQFILYIYIFILLACINTGYKKRILKGMLFSVFLPFFSSKCFSSEKALTVFVIGAAYTTWFPFILQLICYRVLCEVSL